jgi:antitoxin component of MazEF toxin-antitoxin module
MVHKIIDVGHSKAVVIPKEIVRQAGLKRGSRVDVSFNAEDGSVVVKPVAAKGDLDPKFTKALRRGLERYKGALKELASR